MLELRKWNSFFAAILLAHFFVYLERWDLGARLHLSGALTVLSLFVGLCFSIYMLWFGGTKRQQILLRLALIWLAGYGVIFLFQLATLQDVWLSAMGMKAGLMVALWLQGSGT